MDILQKCSDYNLHNELRAAEIYPYYRGISSPQDPVVTMNGQKVVMLGSNNYLGLTSHPAVKEAADRRPSPIRYGLCRLATPQRHPRHPRRPRGEARHVHAGRGRADLLDRLPRQPRRALLPARPPRRGVPRRDGPRLDHRRRPLGFAKSIKFRHNDTADLEASSAADPGEEGQADRRRRRLLDGGRRREAARDRRAEEQVRRAPVRRRRPRHRRLRRRAGAASPSISASSTRSTS